MFLAVGGPGTSDRSVRSATFWRKYLTSALRSSYWSSNHHLLRLASVST